MANSRKKRGARAWRGTPEASLPAAITAARRSSAPLLAAAASLFVLALTAPAAHAATMDGIEAPIATAPRPSPKPAPAPAAEVAPAAAPAPAGVPEDPRDARIRDLERRLDALERALVQAQAPQAPGPVLAGPPDPAPPAAAAPVAIAAAPTPAPAARPAEAAIDALAAERALERTLVRTGALLLPKGDAEFEPSLSYVRSEANASHLFVGPNGPIGGDRGLERDEGTLRLSGRVGLAWDAQLEASVGVTTARDSVRTSIGGVGVDTVNRDATAATDVTVSVAKTLLRERGLQPDLIARLTWDSASGEAEKSGVGFRGGFHEVEAGLVALKRQDPLVFVGSASYRRAFEKDDIKPGDQVTFGGAALLAVSPETSMRLSFAATRSGKAEFTGRRIEGTDATAATLGLGFATILSRNLLLDIGLDVGLTDDSPRYALVVSTPLRLPGLFRRR